MNSFSDRLAAVDWQALDANHVASWLQDLASNDPSVRLKAFNRLEAEVIDVGSQSWEHYGPIEELLKSNVVVFVPQFLILFLEDTSVQEKENILSLLTDLANKIYLDTGTIKTESDRTKAYRTYEAVLNGTPVYQTLRDTSENIAVQNASAELLRILEKASTVW
jgi:hypothetical protein